MVQVLMFVLCFKLGHRLSTCSSLTLAALKLSYTNAPVQNLLLLDVEDVIHPKWKEILGLGLKTC